MILLSLTINLGFYLQNLKYIACSSVMNKFPPEPNILKLAITILPHSYLSYDELCQAIEIYVREVSYPQDQISRTPTK